MSFKDITVVITSFKSSEKINHCLHSIDRQCQVIVIENSSDLEFKTRIERDFSNVKCILTGKNLGYGTANNIGLNKVQTKYALILNPDAILDSFALKNFFNEIKSVPDFAIMGPYIQEKKDEIKKIDIQDSSLVKVSNIKGFAMFLNLPEFKDIGFFDEMFFIYFEEIDLCKRLIKNNKKIYLSSNIKITHKGGQSHDIFINTEMELSRNWHWMWSTFNYHKKHKGFLISLLIVLPKLISAAMKSF